VAFILVAVFLPEQAAQAVEYDWRVLWHKPAVGAIAPSYLKDLGNIDTALAIRNILKDIANKPITVIKVSSNLTINLDKPLKMSNQKIDEIFEWLKGRPCGSKALFDYLNYIGSKASEQDIAILALTIDILNDVVKPEGNPEVIKTSLFSLSKVSEFFGQKLYPIKINMNPEPNTQNLTPLVPFIAHLNGDHYVLVTRISEDKVYFSDNHREEFLPKEKFLKEFSGYALGSKLVADGLEISASQAKTILGSGRDPGKYSNSVNWSKWSKSMTTSILTNLAFNMVSSSFSGGIKKFPSNFINNFGSNLTSGLKSMTLSFAVQTYVQGRAMEKGWSASKTALVGSFMGGLASGLSSSISSINPNGIKAGPLKITSGVLLNGMTTAISQATATRVYLSLYKASDPRTNATAQIGALAAGLFMTQAGNNLMQSINNLPTSSIFSSRGKSADGGITPVDISHLNLNVAPPIPNTLVSGPIISPNSGAVNPNFGILAASFPGSGVAGPSYVNLASTSVVTPSMVRVNPPTLAIIPPSNQVKLAPAPAVMLSSTTLAHAPVMPINTGNFWANNSTLLTTSLTTAAGAGLGYALNPSNRVNGALIGAGIGAGIGYSASSIINDPVVFRSNILPTLVGGALGATVGALTDADGKGLTESALVGFGLGATTGLLVKNNDFAAMGGISGAIAGYMYGGGKTKDRIRYAALGFAGGSAVGSLANLLDKVEKKAYLKVGLTDHYENGRLVAGHAATDIKALKQDTYNSYRAANGTSYGDILKYITVKSGSIMLEESFRSSKYEKIKKEGTALGKEGTALDDYIGDKMKKYEIYYSGLGSGFEALGDGTRTYSTDNAFKLLGQGLMQGGLSIGISQLRNKLIDKKVFGITIDPVTASNITMLASAAGRALTDSLIAKDSFYNGGIRADGSQGLGFSGYVQQATNKALTFGWDAKKDSLSDAIAYNNYVTQIVNFGQKAANPANGGLAVVYGQHLADSLHYSAVENVSQTLTTVGQHVYDRLTPKTIALLPVVIDGVEHPIELRAKVNRFTGELLSAPKLIDNFKMDKAEAAPLAKFESQQSKPIGVSTDKGVRELETTAKIQATLNKDVASLMGMTPLKDISEINSPDRKLTAEKTGRNAYFNNPEGLTFTPILEGISSLPNDSNAEKYRNDYLNYMSQPTYRMRLAREMYPFFSSSKDIQESIDIEYKQRLDRVKNIPIHMLPDPKPGESDKSFYDSDGIYTTADAAIHEISHCANGKGDDGWGFTDILRQYKYRASSAGEIWFWAFNGGIKEFQENNSLLYQILKNYVIQNKDSVKLNGLNLSKPDDYEFIMQELSNASPDLHEERDAVFVLNKFFDNKSREQFESKNSQLIQDLISQRDKTNRFVKEEYYKPTEIKARLNHLRIKAIHKYGFDIESGNFDINDYPELKNDKQYQELNKQVGLSNKAINDLMQVTAGNNILQQFNQNFNRPSILPPQTATINQLIAANSSNYNQSYINNVVLRQNT